MHKFTSLTYWGFGHNKVRGSLSYITLKGLKPIEASKFMLNQYSTHENH